MTIMLKVLGWTLRASAAICITYITVSVLRGVPAYSTLPGLLGGLVWHAGFAMSGVTCLWFARRLEDRKSEQTATA